MEDLRVKIRLPDEVKFILDRLQSEGYEAYIVGGCVRDSVLGKEPHDWDICTSAIPDEIMRIFVDKKVILTGLKHGTVSILVNSKPYEVTTYRIDGEYEDARRPKKVEFTTSLAEDLSRRDFTINAMAYNENGLVDLFGGISDIHNKVIRCVGEPAQRFSEDALRIMRAMRFAANLGFKIEQKTFKAMSDKKKLLNKISVERINSELCKTLVCDNESLYTTLKKCEDILKFLFPIITENFDINIKNVSNSSSLLAVRVALFFDLQEDLLAKTLKDLRFDNNTIKNAVNIRRYGQEILCYNREKYEPRYFIKRIMHDIGFNCAEKAIMYSIAYSKTKCNKMEENLYKNFLYLSLLIESKDECYSISQLAVNGNDIKHFGFEGRQIGIMLEYLLDLVMKGVLNNTRVSLLGRLERLK